MAKTVISVEHLSKSYRLGVIGTGTAFGDLKRWWAKKRGKPDPYLKIGSADYSNREGETIWALEDINFTVEQGDTLGIIGRNGAGKSTLLKILSQVTAPTEGVVKVKGRIASLLEVGTGFHGELTGRENIYLNGAINGMNRSEVKRKLDEIVDFSGVEKYIDTPVKRYSSGMYVRLAFAVAAHLDPDILVVDEVLAVGDAEFQKKCLGKMSDVAHEGRTVLFVSHNMESIEKLCSRALLLQEGKLAIDHVNVKEVIDNYILTTLSDKKEIWENLRDEYENRWFKPIRVMVVDKNNEVLDRPIRNNEDIFLIIEGDVKEVNKDLVIGYYCYSEKINYPVYLSQFDDAGYDYSPKIIKGRNAIKTPIPKSILNSGKYFIKPYVNLKFGKGSKMVVINQMDNKIVVSFSISSVLNNSVQWTDRSGIIATIQTWKNI